MTLVLYRPFLVITIFAPTYEPLLKSNHDLKVDEAGIPIGCKGLADFNMGVWNKAKRGDGKVNPGWLNQGRVPRRAFNPQCGLQKAGNTATFMKQYADDETRWLNDFGKI